MFQKFSLLGRHVQRVKNSHSLTPQSLVMVVKGSIHVIKIASWPSSVAIHVIAFIITIVGIIKDL